MKTEREASVPKSAPKKPERKIADERQTRLSRHQAAKPSASKVESEKISSKRPNTQPAKKSESLNKVPKLPKSKPIKKLVKPAKTLKLKAK